MFLLDLVLFLEMIDTQESTESRIEIDSTLSFLFSCFSSRNFLQ